MSLQKSRENVSSRNELIASLDRTFDFCDKIALVPLAAIHSPSHGKRNRSYDIFQPISDNFLGPLN